MVAGQQALPAAGARPRVTLLRASVVLLSVAAVSKLTTIAADSYVAAKFGLSADADVYLLAIGLIGVLLGAPGETLRLSVVPICGERLRAGDQRRAAGVVALALLSVVVLGGLATLALAGAMPWIAPVAAPGFGGAELAKLVDLSRVLAPALVLGLVMALLLGVLHAQLRFGVPAIAGIGLGAGVIGAGVLLGGRLGVTALALGYVAGSGGVVLVLAWLSRGLWREGVALRAAAGEVRPFLRLALPTGFALSIVSAGAFLERAIASATGAGNVAALGYAIKLITQAGIVSQSIWTPLTPLLTASGASSEREGDGRLVPFSLRLILLVLVPATAVLIALREPLVAVIFQRGAFTAADTGRTATLLALHSGSLVGVGLFMVAVAALLSFRDAKTRLVASALFLASKVALMGALAPAMGVDGVALASSVSSLLAGAYAVHILARRFSAAERSALLAFGAKTALGALVAFGAALPFAELSGGSLASDLLRLAGGTLAAALAYLMALKLLGVTEIDALFSQLRLWLRQGTR
ncbi:MAG: hypothetical protein HY723_02880 [Chloroflexi bacterium]|nr:hypothetical protein [Chloroflexota bacterium]